VVPVLADPPVFDVVPVLADPPVFDVVPVLADPPVFDVVPVLADPPVFDVVPVLVVVPSLLVVPDSVEFAVDVPVLACVDTCGSADSAASVATADAIPIPEEPLNRSPNSVR